MKRSEVIFGVLRIPVDALAVLAALSLSYRLREAQVDLIPRVQLLDPATTLPPFDHFLRIFVLPSVVGFLIFSALLGLYVLRSTRSAWKEIGGIFVAALLWLVGVMAWYFFVEKELFYSRILLFHGVFFTTFFCVAGRMSLTLIERSLLGLGIGSRIVVSIGRHAIAPIAEDVLRHDSHYRYIGHLLDLPALRRLSPLPSLDLVVQTDPDPESEETNSLIEFCRSHHIGYAFLPPVFADVPHQLFVERLGLVPMVCFVPTPLDGWGRVAKRLFDIAGSLALIALFSPLFVVISLLILLSSGWPIFFVSSRVGERGRGRIPVLKFRSMVCDAEARRKELEALSHRKDGPLFKIHGDPRVTAFGRFLRRWSLDELPQFFNVFVGHMSLTGPRPHLPDEVEKYSHFERRVFAVKPGITGLAQVSGRSNLSFKEEVNLDLKYVEEWSPLLDLWILWRTISAILKKDGAD